MCGRVRLSSDYSEIKIKLKFAANAPAPNFEADWNKPPTAPTLVVIQSVDGECVPKMMKWGLIPHWAKDDKLAYSTFNARSESSRPSRRSARRGDDRACSIATSAATSPPLRRHAGKAAPGLGSSFSPRSACG